MKRDFGLTIAPGLAAALLLSGCGPNPRACVDAQSRRVAEVNCRSGGSAYYRWYYGGTGARAAYGERVSGGSYSNEGVSRGGFGGSAHESGGG
ncbi:MAG TPA: hypothetical protein VG841_02925 [Caulobacterales bacterium]|nr:hypothetical protein [Caulobacterales bacterium]